MTPQLKKLRTAVIDAIDSCEESDDESVWLELISFLPEWQDNLIRARYAKIPHFYVQQKRPRCKACELCGEQRKHSAHQVPA